LTVGYLGNQSDTEPESEQIAVWRTRTAAPRLMGPVRLNVIAELVDVNDRCEAAGMTGTLDPSTGFTLAQPLIWRTGWPGLRPLRVPAASRRANPVLVTNLRHQQPWRDRRQRLRARGQGLLEAASHRSRALDLRLRALAV
jgi:hypothetical protein